MPVTEWFIIKSLTVPSSWIAVLFALIVAGIIVWRKFGKDTEDWYSDAAIVFLLVWKFSVILTDFSSVVEYPLSVLYFNGGVTGIYMGLVVALSRLLWRLRKQEWLEQELTALILAFVMVQSLYQFLMVVLNEAEVFQKIITIVMFSGMLILTWLKAPLSTVWRTQLAILFLCTHVFVATIQPEGLIQTPLFVTTLFVICSLGAGYAKNLQEKQTGERT